MLNGEPCIFVDDVMIARKQGVVRSAHAASKLPAPVLRAERPWEATAHDRRIYVYGTVLPDETAGGWRLWYMHASGKVLYATSQDGLRWDRPELGLVEFDGSSANNLLPINLQSPSVILDPASPASERYKMLGNRKAGGKHGYYAAHSPDGIHWNFYENNPILPGGDTCSLAHDPQTGEFLAFHKRSHTYRGQETRLVYLSVSRDMQSWTEPVLVMAPDEIDDEQTRSEGGLYSQFYSMSAFPFAGQWLGLVTHFRYRRRLAGTTPGQSGQDGPIDVQLVHSRDGRRWHRCENRSPVIANGPHGYDAGCILGTANQPVIAGDEMWLYYTAINTTHGGALPEKQVSIARASWRREGFVSLDAGPSGGVVETVPIPLSGKRLWVNAEATGGEVMVEVLDEAGQAVPGYGPDACLPLRGDSVRQAVRWKDREMLPMSPVARLRLRFRLRSARLFSYCVQ